MDGGREDGWREGWTGPPWHLGPARWPRGFAQPETIEGERAMPDVSDLVAAAAALLQPS